MSRYLDRKLRQQGTRFRLFPQSPSLPAFLVPEPVYIASPPGSIAAGPLDARMYVVDPVRKDRLYGYPYLPPWPGPVHRPPCPGPDGHYDHLAPGSRELTLVVSMIQKVVFSLSFFEPPGASKG